MIGRKLWVNKKDWENSKVIPNSNVLTPSPIYEQTEIPVIVRTEAEDKAFCQQIWEAAQKSLGWADMESGIVRWDQNPLTWYEEQLDETKKEESK